MLELVRHDIISSKGRTRDHHHEQLTLPTELLPGAIALLTEVRRVGEVRNEAWAGS